MRYLIPIFLTNTYTICVDWLQNFSQFFFLLCIHILWTMILLLLIKRWASWIWANIVFGFGEQKLVEMTVYQLLDKISRSLVQFHVLFWNPTTNIWSNPSCLQITSSFQNLKKRKLKKKNVDQIKWQIMKDHIEENPVVPAEAILDQPTAS